MADFLLEIGLEEIPARMIAPASRELGKRVEELFTRERLSAAREGAVVTTYSTPRRIAVLVVGVLAQQEDTEELLTGPSWKVAFKDDQATSAAVAFARKAGVEVTQLTKLTNAKGDYVSATVKRPGRTAAEVIVEQLPKEIAGIYWAKSMYWRAGKPERFVRPMRWLLALLDGQIVPVEFAGIAASNVSYGHRILFGDEPITIKTPKDYVAALAAAHVIADPEVRRAGIRKALDAMTRKVPGARWREDEALVDTVVHLTEAPSVLLGSFEKEYLTLPEEVLVTVMRDHQKYFAIEDSEGKLAPCFLAVLNTEADPQGLIRHGNERVLRARFNDARFFWNYDQKIKLEERVEMLKSVTFQKDLGSYYDKTQANLKLAEVLADAAIANRRALDKPALLKAVELAKADLTAELVKEFTELQGVVGGLYARAQGHGETVAQAIYSQYKPASIEDEIPSTVEGQVLGLADRMNTIVAMFAIGLGPTGSKDPFALRRAANGVIKILADSDLPITMAGFINVTMPASPDREFQEVEKFFNERLAFYLKEVRGFRYDVVAAVLAARADVISNSIPNAIARAEALTAALGSEDFLAVCAAFKRIKNILRQNEGEAAASNPHFTRDFFRDREELGLFDHWSSLQFDVEPQAACGDYAAVLRSMATLRAPVDAFFDKLMVMAPEPNVRDRRLGLIRYVLSSFRGIADFSEIVTEK